METRKFQHVTDRTGCIDEKNLLLTGEISLETVAELIKGTSGHEFVIRKHHTISDLDVYIFKPKGWYIKMFYFSPRCLFYQCAQVGSL